MKWLVACLLCVACCGPAWAGEEPEQKESLHVEDETTSHLIEEIGTIPTDPGSNPNWPDHRSSAVPMPQRPRPEQVVNQLKRRFYSGDLVTRDDIENLVRTARSEDAAVLTDRTSMRGDMYRYIFDALLREQRLSYEDERWARSVHYLDIESPRAVDRHWFAYARIRVRRLANDNDWRMQVDKVLYEPVRRGEWTSWDGYYDLRPAGKGKLEWCDFNQRIYSDLIRYSGYYPADLPITHRVEMRIFEGDEHIDLWWPVARFDEEISFTEARVQKGDSQQGARGWYERVESMDPYELVDEPQKYVDWLAKHLRVNIDYEDWDAVELGEVGSPSRFSFYLPPDKGDRNPDLQAFTFGGLVDVVLEFKPGGRYGDEEVSTYEVHPLMSDPAWWALRDELDEDGNRRFVDGGGYLPLYRPKRRIRSSAALNDKLVGAYIEIRFGMEVLGDDGYRAIADLEAERFLAQTVRVPIDDSIGVYGIVQELKSQSGMLDIGYLDQYEDGEVDGLVEEYGARGYRLKKREGGGVSWRTFPTKQQRWNLH